MSTERLEILRIEDIRQDGQLQLRADGTDEALAREYADEMQRGASFQPVRVCRDAAGVNWLYGGFTRTLAASLAGRANIEALVRPGEKRDALLLAAAENADHGKRRTRADIQHVIATLLRDAEWRVWSDRALAETVGVDGKTVGAARKRLVEAGEIPDVVTRVGADGRGYDFSPPAGAPSTPLEPEIFEQFGESLDDRKTDEPAEQPGEPSGVAVECAEEPAEHAGESEDANETATRPAASDTPIADSPALEPSKEKSSRTKKGKDEVTRLLDLLDDDVLESFKDAARMLVGMAHRMNDLQAESALNVIEAFGTLAREFASDLGKARNLSTAA